MVLPLAATNIWFIPLNLVTRTSLPLAWSLRRKAGATFTLPSPTLRQSSGVIFILLFISSGCIAPLVGRAKLPFKGNMIPSMLLVPNAVT